MSNPSARNSSLNRSVSANDLLIAASKFHAPGPRNMFLPVISAGYGPKSEIPNTRSKGAELAVGSVRTVYWLGPTLTGVPEVVRGTEPVEGTYLGIPYPAPAFAEEEVSNIEKGAPVRAVNIPTSVQPPSI